MPPAGFEPTISAGERPKTYALDREATGTGYQVYSSVCNSALINTKLIKFLEVTADKLNALGCKLQTRHKK